MNKLFNKSFIIAHISLLVLLILIFIPGLKHTQPATALVAGICVMECFYLYQLHKSHKLEKELYVPSNIITIIWIFMIIWEILVTKLNCMHPVLFPSIENVFYVFQSQYKTILINIFSTMELLAISIIIGVVLGVVLGVTVGWIPTLRDVLYPIANVLAPIPSIVYAPYIICIMPSFRMASAMVIVIGIFFPMFLNMVNRVKSIDTQILDSARMLNVNNRSMIIKILIPYVIPGVIMGMKVTLTTSFMLLMFAEMMGATSGLGYYIVNYNTYGNYTNVIACIIVIGIIVTILNWLTTLMQKHLIKWQSV